MRGRITGDGFSNFPRSFIKFAWYDWTEMYFFLSQYEKRYGAFEQCGNRKPKRFLRRRERIEAVRIAVAEACPPRIDTKHRNDYYQLGSSVHSVRWIGFETFIKMGDYPANLFIKTNPSWTQNIIRHAIQQNSPKVLDIFFVVTVDDTQKERQWPSVKTHFKRL